MANSSLTSHTFYLSVPGIAFPGVVSSPDQIFRARPADSSKNRVWTLSLGKLGQVYIWQAVNWVIVGVISLYAALVPK